ncbi:MAG: hypothetical protein AAFO94_18930, partial [Bacteroidota bacterium]
MAFDESKNEQIERYLQQRLEGEELRQFEAELQSNQALADEVALEESMRELLADTPENQLRQSLHMLNETTVIDDQDGPDSDSSNSGSSSGGSYKWLWVVVPVALLGGWWMMSNAQAPDSVSLETEKVEPASPIPPSTPTTQPSPPAKEDDDEPLELEVPEEKVTLPDVPIVKEEKEQTPDVVPEIKSYASPKRSPFAPNPELDLLVGELASTMTEVRTRTRVGAFSDGTAKVTLIVTGSFPSEKDLSGHKFRFYLYSSNPADYRQKRPLKSTDFSLDQSSPGNYSVDFQSVQQLGEGRYYYLMIDETLGKNLLSSQLEVVSYLNISSTSN